MIRFIKATDAAWMLVESAEQPVHVACMAICSRPPGAPRGFVREMVEEWRQHRHFAPPFNYVYRPWPFPAWRELPDEAVDLEYHFRHKALPEPGSERDLGMLVSQLHSHALDRRRPLWECHLIEGLEHDRFAIYLKVHHSQIDGIGGIRLIRRVFSADPHARGHQPPWAVGLTSARPAGTESSRHAPGWAEQLRTQALATQPVLKLVSRLAREAARREHPETALPFNAPKTVLNGRIHGPRRFATQHYALDRIKRLAKSAGVTVNDVFLAICAGALRRYLEESGKLPRQTLSAGLPVSVRPAEDASVGNAISLILAKLYTDVADPLERLQAIAGSARAAKQQLEQLPKSAIDQYTLLVNGPYLLQLAMGLGGYGRPLYSLLISNVPGPAETLYFNGARMDEIYPISLLFNGQALNISVVSYAGQFNLGFTGCRDSLPSMQKLAVYTGEALQELELALGATGRNAA